MCLLGPIVLMYKVCRKCGLDEHVKDMLEKCSQQCCYEERNTLWLFKTFHGHCGAHVVFIPGIRFSILK